MRNTDSSKAPRFTRQDKSVYAPVEGWEVVKQTGDKGEIDFQETLVKAWSLDPTDLSNNNMTAVYYTQFVIDTIRASVLGDDLRLGGVGPPIVRFRFGTVFNEAPFIVKNFSVDYDKKGGYEVNTLLPRIVTFNLELEEFRQTKGSHHGEINDQVPGAGNVLELDTGTLSNSLAERRNFPI